MDYNELIRTANITTADTQWFNGTNDSIFNRLDRLQNILDDMRFAASNSNIPDLELGKIASYITELDEEKSQLEKLASEWVDYDHEEYLQSLPGGTVASTYRVNPAGTLSLGEDDGSLLYRTASAVENEFKDADWINFVTAGAEVWLEDQNHALLQDQISTREAASFYVEKKTLPILDMEKRATIIDNFISNVEICRRAKKESIDTKRATTEKKLRVASKLTEHSIDDSFGSTLNWF
jgi:hypothetical protein